MALKTTITLAATERGDTGKGAARKLRQDGKVPAVIYGRGREPTALALAAADYDKAMAGHSGASILDLDVDGKTVKALVRDVQRHPVRRVVTHVDFYEIHEGVAITLNVPIHLEGIPTGVKNQGGVLDQSMREVEIEVLPRDIPEFISVDVTELEIGDSIHLRDIKAENLKFLAELDTSVCSVAAPRVEEEPVTEEEEGLEDAGPEVIGQEDPEGDSASAETSGDS